MIIGIGILSNQITTHINNKQYNYIFILIYIYLIMILVAFNVLLFYLGYSN